MRITVDIEDEKLDALLKWTRQTKKSPAIAAAINEFIEHKQRQAFLDRVLAGETSYSASNEQVESLASLVER
jgi:metal-responsive CopG/Arc/MetJ family transcriptional regulator